MSNSEYIFHPPLSFGNDVVNFIHFLKENNISLPGDMLARMEQQIELEGKEFFAMNNKKQEYEKAKATYYTNKEERYELFQTAFKIVRATHGKDTKLNTIINSFKRKKKGKSKSKTDISETILEGDQSK